MFKRISFFILLLMTKVAMAQSTIGQDTKSFGSFFTLAPSDKSWQLLGMLFGNMGNLLPKEPMTVLGIMFKEFNNAILVLAVIVVSYAIIMGVISTAHEGEFLGKKFNSVWVPIRSVLGIGLLIPTKLGYCVLQLFMMWIVVQGIGAADQLWATAYNASVNPGGGFQVPLTGLYEQGGSGSTAQTDAGSSSGSQFSMQFLTYRAMQLAMCTAYYAKDYPNGGTFQKPSESLQWSMKSGSISISVNNTLVYNYPAVSPTDAGCGSIKINLPATNAQGNFKNSSFSVSKIKSLMTDALNTVQGAASQWVKSDCIGDGSCTAEAGQVISAGNLLVQGIQNAGAPPGHQSASGSPDLTGNAVKFGWIYAGTFYWELAKDTYGTDRISYLSNSAKISPPKTVSAGTGNAPYANTSWTNFQQEMGNYAKDNPTVNASLAKMNGDQLSDSWGSGGGGPLRTLTNWIVTAFTHILTGVNPTSVINGDFIKNTKNAIIQIQQFGNRIVNSVEMVWFIVLLSLGVILMLNALPSSGMIMPIFGKLLTIALVIAVFISFVLVIFLVAGLTMSVYVPLIPYLIFFFTAFGWLMAVIETMLAAPLVALGLTHPEGHEVYGRAEPALMLITNVFLRPTFMIFGLIVGTILTYVGVTFLNGTFSYFVLNAEIHGQVYSGASIHTGDAGAGPFQIIMYLAIYIGIVIVIINKSYSLIHLIPDQVMRWIGNQQQFGQYDEGEKEVAGKADSAAKAGGEQAKLIQEKQGQMAKQALESGQGPSDDQAMEGEDGGGGSGGE
jgi:defect in organelle trafficking protein DotA